MTIRTDHPLRRTGKVLTIALPVVGIVGLSALVALPSRSQATQPERLSIEDVAPRSMIVGAELQRLGLTPEVLAAAGLNAAEVSQLVAAAAIDSDFGIDRYRSARVAHAEAKRDLETLAARVRKGLEPATDMDAKRAHERACLAACEAAESALFDLLGGVMSGSEIASLERIRANIADGVALPHAAAPLTAGERLRLRDALAARAESERTGQPMHTSASAFLASIQSLPEVTTAGFGLDGSPVVRSSFDAALRNLDN